VNIRRCRVVLFVATDNTKKQPWPWAVVLIALHGPAPGRLGLTAYLMAIALYVLIGTLAIDPHLVSRIGLGAAPVRAEAVLLIILVFAGVNVGWLLLFEEAPDRAFTGRGGQARQASLQHARD